MAGRFCEGWPQSATGPSTVTGWCGKVRALPDRTATALAEGGQRGFSQWLRKRDHPTDRSCRLSGCCRGCGWVAQAVVGGGIGAQGQLTNLSRDCSGSWAWAWPQSMRPDSNQAADQH